MIYYHVLGWVVGLYVAWMKDESFIACIVQAETLVMCRMGDY